MTASSKKRNPAESANCISRLFFWWTLHLFSKGSKRDLTEDDIYEPLTADESETLANRLEATWDIELEKLKHIEYNVDQDSKKVAQSPEPSLVKAIIRTFWTDYLLTTTWLAIQYLILRILQPVFLSAIISFFHADKDGAAQEEALLYATGLVITTVIGAFLIHHSDLQAQRLGMKIRVACSSLLYRKSLKLSKASLGKTTGGQVINLLSNDVSRFDVIPTFFCFIVIMPLQVIIVGSIMWQQLGVSTIIGIGCLFVMTIPMQAYISKRGGQLRAAIARLTDKRVQLMSELISGIQVIKTYAWEIPFNKIVSRTRKVEIKEIKKSSNFRGLYLSVMVFTERTTLFFTVVSFILMNNTISAEISFSSASYFNLLQMSVAIYFPQALILCGEALISIKRLEEFLLLDEIQYSYSTGRKISQGNKHSQEVVPVKGPVSVELQNASANWVTGQLPPTLCNVSMKIDGGQLSVLVGAVGSGKSSLLNLLLRELPLGAGAVKLLQLNNNELKNKYVQGFIKDNPEMKISFASQDAWLFSGTLRENILFGQPYIHDRYQEVTRVCSLVRDFKQLPNADMTIVGDRGASLSGGQRARVNLARAIYRQADLYLLDDPLSAVDARVARRLFNDCIVKYLKGKTRILVTHQLHFLKQADTIVVLERGGVKYQGTFNELTNSYQDFNQMMNQLQEAGHKEQGGEEINELGENEEPREKNILRQRSLSIKSFNSYSTGFDEDNEIEHTANANNTNEAMTSGQLTLGVYARYFRAGNRIFSVFLLVLVFILAQVATSGADYWLSYWTNIEVLRTALHDESTNKTAIRGEYSTLAHNPMFEQLSMLDEDGLLPRLTSIYIYTFCLLFCIIFMLIRSQYFMTVCMNSGKELHGVMFANVLQAPMYFFNTNSAGRILNRFSKDIGVIDELLPKTMLEALQIFLVMLGIIVMITVVNYWMLIPTVIMGIIFYFLRNHYLKTAQDIKRLEGIAKSPVFSHVGATLNGLTTIRSRGTDVELMLRKEFDQFQDDHTGAWYLTLVAKSAFGLSLDLLSSVFVACVAFSLILMDHGDTLSGSVGLAISQSLILTGMLQYGVRQSTEAQSQMTAVERILEYTDLPKEKSTESTKVSIQNWPSAGRIQFKDVSMSYKKGEPPVLKNLNFIIEAGWKVGVVGRTGAGKSSLIQALFRLTDGLEGAVLIDGVDTKSIELQDLRSSISIIPQEPVLFSQSLRYNLDPFGKYSDDALWDALREVELTDATLNQMVTEGGTNFSVGQRQLICLARAILRRNRILVLDEATANIDTRTDELIQRTIRTKFADCTVITIAHRLNTIIDSDKIIVMDGGRMMEYDSAFALLNQEPRSQFASMVQETGSTMANKLFEMASSYHMRTRSNSLNSNNSIIMSEL